MRRTILALLLRALVLVPGAAVGLALNIAISAQGLDTTFGSGGKLIINTLGALATTDDMAIQPDNKIILVSECMHLDLSGVPFCAIRLNEDGSADFTFRGGPPVFSAGVFTWFDTAHTGGVKGVVIQTDGKIIAVGFGPGLTAALVRYNSNGSLDTTFGSGGVVLTDVTAGSDDIAEKVAIQPDGKIVIVGSTGVDQFVARYLSNGTLDSSFGTGGIAKTVIAGDSIQGRSLALQPDGKIMAGGHVVSGSYSLTRLNSNGLPDATWDGDGLEIIPVDPAGTPNPGWTGIGIRSVAIQPDGRVVAVGHKNIIFAFNADGSPDTGFDVDGSRVVFEGSNRETYSTTVSSAGKYWVVGGTVSGPVPYHYLIARFNPDGTYDTTFNGVGHIGIAIESGFNSEAIAVQTDAAGRLVVAGLSGIPFGPVPITRPVLSAVRFSAPTVVPSAAGISGRLTRADGRPVANALLSTDVGGGTVLYARSNPFGYYRFAGVMTGQTYAISAKAKGQTFTDRSVFVSGQIVNFNFTGQ
jgi:uncharacterized delta-60 repeat protein